MPPYGYVLASAEFAANKNAAVIMLMYVNIFFIVILFIWFTMFDWGFSVFIQGFGVFFK